MNTLDQLRNVLNSCGNSVLTASRGLLESAVAELGGLRNDVLAAEQEADRLALLAAKQAATIDRLRRAIPVDTTHSDR